MSRILKYALLATFVAAPAAAQGQAAGSGDPLTAALKRQFDGVARNMKEAAEKMPAEKYSFRATPDVRTFAAFVGHIINAQYAQCSRAKGVENPNKQDWEKNVTDKAAIVKGITEANDYCAAVFNAANDKWMLETVTQTMGGTTLQVPRAAILAGNTSHTNESYGSMATYMRLNGLVPPSTERAQQQRRPTQ
jgi:uncharacterized damage-inducible protein DinB